MNNIRFRKKGFTLIELLVVCGVISVLATITIVSFVQSQTKSRDSKRKADLETVSQAVVMFQSEYKTLPGGGTTPSPTVNTVIFSSVTPSSQFFVDLNKYLPTLPHDPKIGKAGIVDYYYYKNATKYYIYSVLENTKDASYKQCVIPAGVGQTNKYQYAVPSQDYAPNGNCF